MKRSISLLDHRLAALVSIPRLSDRLQGSEDNVDIIKGGTDGDNMQKSSAEAIPFSLGIGQADRENDSCSTYQAHCATVVLTVAVFEEPNFATVSVLQSAGDVESGSSVGVRMVVHRNGPGE